MSQPPIDPGSKADGYERGKPAPRMVILLLVTIFLFVLFSGFGIQAFFGSVVANEVHAKRGEIPNTQWDTLKADATKQLNSYGWVDDKAVHIPLSRALELTVQDLNKPASEPAPAKK